MYLVVFKVDMRNHLQVVLDIRVPPFPHMTGLHFKVSYQMFVQYLKVRNGTCIKKSKKLSEMQYPHQYQEWKGNVPHNS